MPTAPRKRPSERPSRLPSRIGHPTSLRARFERAVAVRLHSLAGRTLFRLGRHRAAKRRFERVLQLRGDHFVSYVHLGRIAYKLGDYAGWREQCAHARRTAPERFARLRHPFELFEPRTGWSLDGGRERSAFAQGTLQQPSAGGLEPLAPSTAVEFRDSDSGDDSDAHDFGTVDLGAGDPGDTAMLEGGGTGPERVDDLARGAESESVGRWFDDFVDRHERRKFRQLDPIAPAEMRSCDLDDLARRLTES